MRNLLVTTGILFATLVSPASAVIISEFLQDVCDQSGLPETGPASGQFIVIYHIGPGTIDLQGWTIGQLQTPASSTITTPLELSPGDRVVFGEVTQAAFEAEYGLLREGQLYHQIDLPDFQANDGIAFERLSAGVVTAAACNSRVAYASPVQTGQLVLWDSALTRWVSGGDVSIPCSSRFIFTSHAGLSEPLCTPTGPCDITQVEIARVECSLNYPGDYDVEVLVHYTNAPVGGIAMVNGGFSVVTQNPHRVVLQVAPTNLFTVTAGFPASPGCTRSETVNSLTGSCVCAIDRIEVVSISSCDATGRVAVTMDIFADNPLNYPMQVSGLTDFLETTYTGTPTRVTLTGSGNGAPLAVGVGFSDPFGGSQCIISTNVPIPTCTNICKITQVDLLGFGPCSNGLVQVELRVESVNPSRDGFSIDFLPTGSGSFAIATTTAVTLVSFVAVADGRPLDLRVRYDFDCFVNTNLNVNLPVCPGLCAISNLSVVSVGACDADGMVEVVSSVEFEPSVISDLQVGGVLRPVTSSPMLFTNRYLGDGSTVRIDANWPLSDLSSRCPGQSIGVVVPVCSCQLSNMDIVVAGPCRSDGLVPVDVTFEYTNALANYELVMSPNNPEFFPFPRPERVFALTGSPQTERMLIPRMPGYQGTGVRAVLREPVPLAQPGPFGLTNEYREVCSLSGSTTLPLCPPSTCEILAVNVTTQCLVGGVAEVVVEVVHSNGPIGAPLVFDGLPGLTSEQRSILQASPHLETIYIVGNGSTLTNEVRVRFDSLNIVCATNFTISLPTCSDPCQLTSLVPVGVSPCSNGMVDVTFELSATGATGMLFGVETWGGAARDFFVYTNTPMRGVLRLPGDGAGIDVLAGQVVPSSYTSTLGGYDYNPNCGVFSQQILTVPNCMATPAVCLTIPPAFLDMVTVPTPTFSFQLPFGAVYDLETTVDLTMPWTPMISTERGTNGVESLSLPFQPDGIRFYRLRCRN